MESESSVGRLKEEYQKRIPVLSINQMPDYALKEFLAYAQEKFNGDRGMALTQLLMERKMIGGEALLILIQDLDERVKMLESPNGSSSIKEIKLGDGRKISLGGKKSV